MNMVDTMAYHHVTRFDVGEEMNTMNIRLRWLGDRTSHVAMKGEDDSSRIVSEYYVITEAINTVAIVDVVCHAARESLLLPLVV